jgi:hypothetical protein
VLINQRFQNPRVKRFDAYRSRLNKAVEGEEQQIKFLRIYSSTARDKEEDGEKRAEAGRLELVDDMKDKREPLRSTWKTSDKAAFVDEKLCSLCAELPVIKVLRSLRGHTGQPEVDEGQHCRLCLATNQPKSGIVEGRRGGIHGDNTPTRHRLGMYT